MDLAESLAHRPTAGERHPWEQVRFEFLYSHLQDQAVLKAGSIIIDIGCGDAYITEQLALHHPECLFLGIDPAFTAEHFVSLQKNVTASNIQFFKSQEEAYAAIQGKTAAVILLMDVIEHIESDSQFLKAVREQPFVDNGTTFFITVPAFQSIFTNRDRLLGHYRRYTKKQLAALVQQSGFLTIQSGYFFLFPLFGRALRSLIQRFTPSLGAYRERSLRWNSTKPLHFLTRSLLRIDLFLSSALSRIGLNRFGLSIYSIVKKR